MYTGFGSGALALQGSSLALPAAGGGGGAWDNIGNILAVGNQAALQWYATRTGKPIASGQPNSLMRNVLGTDLSGGPTIEGQTFATLGPLLVIVVVVTGAVFLLKR